MSEPGSFTTVDGCIIHYTLDGPPSGFPLILSNSLGATKAMWDSQVPAFAQGYRVIRYDTRGHGLSSVPPGDYSLDRLGCDVTELMDHLRIAESHFCGISLGGMTGQWLGYRAPHRIRKLIVAHSSAYLGPPRDWQQRMDLVRSKGLMAIADAVASRWVTPDFMTNHADRFRALVAAVASVDVAGYTGCCAAIRDMDLRPVLRLIRPRTLVIAGLQDPATPVEHARLLAGQLPYCRLVELDGAHLSNLEFAANFNREVLGFLVE